MIDIYKMHGTGNTFFLVDETKTAFISEEEKRKLTISLCKDGTDGVLFVEESEQYDIKMRIFNSDGSEPEMCGNGLRCFSRYVLEEYNKNELIVETMHEHYTVSYVKDFYKTMVGIKVGMKNVLQVNLDTLNTFDERHKPYTFKHFTVSNPHVVAFTDKVLSKEVLTTIGKDANESKDVFESGMNVNMITKLKESSIYVQTYERGVGLTKSCGTGMTSASTYYSIENNLIESKIEVFNDGGMIWCTVFKDDKGYKVDFVGNGTYILKAKLDLETYQIDAIVNYDDEEKLYNEFFNYTREMIK